MTPTDRRTRRYTVAEIIATHLGWDIAEVRDCRYQPGVYRCDVFSIGDYYYAAPRATSKLPADWNWHEVGTEFDRKIYRAHMNDDVRED